MWRNSISNSTVDLLRNQNGSSFVFGAAPPPAIFFAIWMWSESNENRPAFCSIRERSGERLGGRSYEPQVKNINNVNPEVWENEEAFENAKKAVAIEYQKQGFNPQETKEKLKIESVRSTYQRSPY